MSVLIVLLGVAVGLLTVLVFGLLRTHADILRALDRAGISLDETTRTHAGVAVGPPPTGPGTSGGVVDIAGTVPGGGPVKVALDGRHHTLLAFLSSGCRTCQTFWEAFTDPEIELPGVDTRLVIVAQDPSHDSESRLVELAPTGVRMVCSSATWQSLDVPGSPYFVMVDGASRTVIGSGTATGWDQVKGLLTQAVLDSAMEGSRAHGAPSVDDALSAAGIGPGHRSLYPDDTESDDTESDDTESDAESPS
ncbi:MAG: hypothetical protein P8L46_08215 [Acidimicrobiales bacterium]|nr:hypothetical protein [Acidimicrobiales bacterium]